MQLSELTNIAITVGVLVAGLGYAYGQFFSGNKKARSEDYNLLELRLDALQKVCDNQQTDISRQQEEIKKLNLDIAFERGVVSAKEIKIKELSDLLANRDPRLTATLELVATELKEIKEFLKANNPPKK